MAHKGFQEGGKKSENPNSQESHERFFLVARVKQYKKTAITVKAMPWGK